MILTDAFGRFTRSESAGGAVLLASSIVSLALANSAWAAGWVGIWDLPLGPLTLRHWINDGLMALFFLLVGLELERELYVGELSDVRAALLPIAAALGGIAVPTAIHFALNANTPSQPGAAIPMATDIAFALAALAVLGNRVPPALKVFLTAFAVIDDLCAILVIALAYSIGLSLAYAGAAAAVFAGLVALNRLRVRAIPVYVLGGIVLWYFTLRSGIHATVAGVLLAFVIPFAPRAPLGASPSHRVEEFLHKPVAFLVLPLFALANTAIAIPDGFSPLGDRNGVGIALGLLVGKPLGISLACAIAVMLGLRKPPGVSWAHIAGAGLLGGIGFTMSIFITQLAFPADSALARSSTLAIMVASLVASAAGIAWLWLATRRPG
jgi:Na+:H+ antiporter, NhaA family